jgi:hypothetical protein
MTDLLEKDFQATCWRHLTPFLDLLEIQKEKVGTENWLEAVSNFKKSVQQNPHQYIGQELPSKEILDTVVHQLFEEFTQRKLSGELTALN